MAFDKRAFRGSFFYIALAHTRARKRAIFSKKIINKNVDKSSYWH